MPHPTTPSSGEAMGRSYSGEGKNIQRTMTGLRTPEQPFTEMPLSSTLKPPRSSVKAEIRFPIDVVPTPPQSPTLSSPWKPPLYRAGREVQSPPVTPESRRYSNAPTISGRRGKIDGDSWEEFADRLADELSVGGYNNTANTGNEKESPTEKSQSPTESALTGKAPPVAMPKSPRDYDGTFNLIVGDEDHYEEYGRGAWSIVYRAEHIPNNRTHGVSGGTKMIVAVKAPIWPGSSPILEHEALILTYLQPKAPSTQGQGEIFRHIVSFLGYHEPTKSLVLESVPLTLAGYSGARGAEAKKNFSHKTMRDPVVGMQTWLYIVRDLVAGLEFLHKRGVVHGDIKPMNILMRPRATTSGTGNTPNENTPLPGGDASQDLYTPVFCDFSSGRLAHPSIPPTEPSALTDRFAPPELLDHRKPGITTFASDTYSLGVALLSPVLGADVYAAAANQMQALHWAKEGRPLDFARNTEGGLRVGRGGVVDRVVSGATRKERGERWSATEWMEVVRSIFAERAQTPSSATK
ncbi:hypothetical protein FGG08_003252 [Glutinoglossum americanum]|uniref:Protein kinase domain-containing protein n=1 Tax=Glutinoglossum americanum TaxID=1670608 RepID=A0A9P8I4N6_9PEZI|nr:hypothetical protein FGG08_003252 [Glutinoglossum americanum]